MEIIPPIDYDPDHPENFVTYQGIPSLREEYPKLLQQWSERTHDRIVADAIAESIDSLKSNQHGTRRL